MKDNFSQTNNFSQIIKFGVTSRSRYAHTPVTLLVTEQSEGPMDTIASMAGSVCRIYSKSSLLCFIIMINYIFCVFTVMHRLSWVRKPLCELNFFCIFVYIFYYEAFHAACLVITSLGEERAGLYVSRASVCLYCMCYFLSFSLPLCVGRWLQIVTVTLLGLFSKCFTYWWTAITMGWIRSREAAKFCLNHKQN